jgi:hypothetical protein
MGDHAGVGIEGGGPGGQRERMDRLSDVETYCFARHPSCPECGFDLFGIRGERCTECGVALEVGLLRRLQRTERGLVLLSITGALIVHFCNMVLWAYLLRFSGGQRAIATTMVTSMAVSGIGFITALCVLVKFFRNRIKCSSMEWDRARSGAIVCLVISLGSMVINGMAWVLST